MTRALNITNYWLGAYFKAVGFLTTLYLVAVLIQH